MNGVRRFCTLVLLSCLTLVLAVPALAQEQTENPALSLDAWHLYDPHDPSLPELMVADSDANAGGSAFRLDPVWQVARIEYLYQWWGLADPVLDYQTIERDGDTFHKGEEVVAAGEIDALLAALVHFYPTQFLLAGVDHTDDYPSWTVELTGTDGQVVLLNSSSSNAHGSVPWNLLVNGRGYAQYDGSLVETLFSLFLDKQGSPAAAFFPGGGSEGTLSFSTSGWLSQLAQGFTGLLPISDGFQYRVDAEHGVLEGRIQGRESIGGFGHMIIGTVTDLEQVQVRWGDTRIDCPLTPLTAPDPAYAAWEFTCDLGVTVPVGMFHYPISVKFATDSGESIETDGVLNGTWEGDPDLFLMPVDPQIQSALMTNADAADLLSDHYLAFASYNGEFNIEQDAVTLLGGETILVGQTEVDGRTLRYSIGTPFVVEDGRLTLWHLSRTSLDAMLDDLLASPLLRKALDLDAGLTLNLWYAEHDEVQPQQSYLINSVSVSYGVSYKACGAPIYTLPSTTQALQAFSLNDRFSFNAPAFLLLDHQPVVMDVSLPIGADNTDPLLPMLAPPVMRPENLTPLRGIQMNNIRYGSYSSRLRLYLPDQFTQADEEGYRAIIESLGGRVNADRSYSTFWQVDGISPVITEEGTVDLVQCSAP